MKNHTIGSLVLILFLCCLFLICPVSSNVVGTTIDKGASVYIGEQGLNITHALNQGSPHTGTIDDIPVNKSIGWWSAGAIIDAVLPTKIIDTSAFYKSLTISPTDFVGYTGSWYVLNNTQTASGASNSCAFIVTDPSIDLSIWDFTSSTDVTGTYVPRGDYIGFRITTNLYNSINYTYRSPIYNTTSDGYIDLKVKNQSGVVYTSLLNSSVLASSLLQHNVSYTPWTWGNAPSAPFNWSTGVTSAGQSVYLTGNYTVFAESQLNGMKDNYKDSSGADYTGKTVSKTYNLILYESPLADFSATPVSGIAPLTVQFTDSSSGPPSGWSWNFGDGPTSTAQNPTHTYTTAGTYTVFLTATNPGGNNTKTRTGYIAVSAPAPTPSSGDSDSGGTGPGPAPAPEQKVEVKEAPVVAQPPQVQQQQPPAIPQQVVPATPETQPVEGLAGVTVAESYPVGFEGMSYNTDGQNSVSIDISSAEQAHATVTTFFDHVEVYQHGSPGVRIFFYFDKYILKDDIITGTAKRAEFVTDPLTVNVSTGKVSGSVQAVLLSIDKPVKVENIITGDIPLTTAETYNDLLAQNNQSVAGIAYLMKFLRGNLTSTGAANVTMTVPLSWVELHGGKDAVKITRTSDETGMTELLKTIYVGPDAEGNMIFRGESPHGTSLFGLVTAKATSVEKQAHPNETYIPASKPAMITNVGMFGWLFGIIFDNPVLVVVPIAVFIAALYFGWWKRRL